MIVFSQEDADDLPVRAEKENRQKVSGILQRLLLLLRASRCSFPAAQWYILQLRWARKVMGKVGGGPRGSCRRWAGLRYVL